jgi:hypothetical protein
MSSHSLPPLYRYSALFAELQAGNELQKFWINREIIGEKERAGSRTRRKRERRQNKGRQQQKRQVYS